MRLTSASSCWRRPFVLALFLVATLFASHVPLPVRASAIHAAAASCGGNADGSSTAGSAPDTGAPAPPIGSNLNCSLASAVLQWNCIALTANAIDHNFTAPDQGGPTRSSRALAIVHAGIFDAVDTLAATDAAGGALPFSPFALLIANTSAFAGASEAAAVSQAAYDALVALFPQQRDFFDAQLVLSLASATSDSSTAAVALGVALGQQAAAATLAARTNDGSQLVIAYSLPPLAGVWQPGPSQNGSASSHGIPPPPVGKSGPLPRHTGNGRPRRPVLNNAAVDPHWGLVRPFALLAGNEFRALAPPALNSSAYAAAYVEVQQLGGDGVTTPTLRTQDQTEAGQFWSYDGTPFVGTPPRLYNQINVQLCVMREATDCGTELARARLLALTNFAIADATISSWDTKYFFNFWRPIRAIRQVQPQGNVVGDFNSATEADRTWTPLGAQFTNGNGQQHSARKTQPQLRRRSLRTLNDRFPSCTLSCAGINFTPQFPSYTAAHATMGSASLTVARLFFGTDAIAFTFVSDELNGVNRDVNGTVRALRPRAFASLGAAIAENGQSRIYLGVHFGFDSDAGTVQGVAVAESVVARLLLPAPYTTSATTTAAATEAVEEAALAQAATLVHGEGAPPSEAAPSAVEVPAASAGRVTSETPAAAVDGADNRGLAQADTARADSAPGSDVPEQATADAPPSLDANAPLGGGMNSAATANSYAAASALPPLLLLVLLLLA